MGKLFKANWKRLLIKFIMGKGIAAAIIIILVLAGKIIKKPSHYIHL